MCHTSNYKKGQNLFSTVIFIWKLFINSIFLTIKFQSESDKAQSASLALTRPTSGESSPTFFSVGRFSSAVRSWGRRFPFDTHKNRSFSIPRFHCAQSEVYILLHPLHTFSPNNACGALRESSLPPLNRQRFFLLQPLKFYRFNFFECHRFYSGINPLDFARDTRARPVTVLI